MSLDQQIACDRCSAPLSERGARGRSHLVVEGHEYLIKTVVERRDLAATDLCEKCLAVVLVQFARLLWQDLGPVAAAAPAKVET